MAFRTKTPDVGITLTSVCRPHGDWYVAGLYNLTGREQTAVFDFNRTADLSGPDRTGEVRWKVNFRRRHG